MLKDVGNMRFLSEIIIFVSLFSLVRSNVVSRELLSFIEHEIVPDVLSVPPEKLLKVSFPNGVQALEGNQLALNEVASVPTLEWDYEPDKYYTLVMCDADAPSRMSPEVRSYLHWLVVNIPGRSVVEGETLSDFMSSRPAPLTGLHRYIFLIYEQPGYLNFEEASEELNRRNFMPEDFANKYGMGAPVAGNFYLTGNFEDLVETIEVTRNVPFIELAK